MSDEEALMHVVELMNQVGGGETDSINVEFKGKEMVMNLPDGESKLRFISSMDKPKITRDGNNGIVTASKIIAEIEGEEHELNASDGVIEIEIAGMGELMDNDMWYPEE